MKNETNVFISPLMTLKFQFHLPITVFGLTSTSWSLYDRLLQKCYLRNYLWFQTLRRLPLSHLTSRRAPGSETAGLRKFASCDPVRARGDRVFGERFCATAEFLFIVAVNSDIPDNEFPNDDYFPDVDQLLGDMTNGAPASSSAAPYVIVSSLLGLTFGLLLVAIDLNMILISYHLDCMTSFNNLLLVLIIAIMLFMFYPLFFWIKLNGKFLKYSTLTLTGNVHTADSGMEV